MKEMIGKVAGFFNGIQNIVVLTGAGMSVDSGIPAFRGSQGLWSKYDPMEYASIDAFCNNPVKVWKMLKELDEAVACAEPNPAHYSLAELERMGRVSLLVTQNIDGLHQAAGSRQVVEFHGSQRRLRCLSCGRTFSRNEVMMLEDPPRCLCGGLIKPDIVFFGEEIPERAIKAAFAMSSICQLMLVVGSSAQVAPASHLPLLAKQAGARVVEINLEKTALSEEISDVVLLGDAGEILPELVEQIREKCDD
ncbi:SIR2 family NAD-dependent protein deacylase [Dethiosulfatarculus sandiegensis]|uniref:protein acetyllysine N-acetyltransferase n=1 Tax=Dethiosulfatarculus sandiegensis TaxID=1429043 RepID=A0A0D2JAD7_9BACT|nr:NAD-dependent deacylase [Dethiosulfatarculus sandiegensis]KIX15099.1 sigma factor [Dethiosulfatarculus sandiegensis]